MGPGRNATLPVHFVPLSIGFHEAVIVLSDGNAGDLYAVVGGRARLPDSMATIHWNCASNSGSKQTLPIPYANASKLKAMFAIPSSATRDPEASKNLTITMRDGRLISEVLQLNVEIRGSNCFAGPKTIDLIPGRVSATGSVYAPHVRL